MELTTGAEFMTAATNLFNAVVTAAVIIRVRKLKQPRMRVRVWSAALGFFFVVCLFGACIHGIVMDTALKVVLWDFLAAILAFMIAAYVTAVLYETEGEAEIEKKARVCTVIAAVYTVSEIVVARLIQIGFMGFIVYSSTAILFSLYKLFQVRSEKPYVIWYIGGLACLILATILDCIKSIRFHLIWDFNYDGVYHIVTLFFVLLTFKGILEAQNNKV